MTTFLNTHLQLLITMHSPTPVSTLFPYTTPFRSILAAPPHHYPPPPMIASARRNHCSTATSNDFCNKIGHIRPILLDRKSTRLNSSHVAISYAVFCLKKKKHQRR